MSVSVLPICSKPAVVVDCSGSQSPKQDEAVVSAEQVASLFQALNAPAAEPSEPNRALQQILEDVSVGVEQLNVQAKVKELKAHIQQLKAGFQKVNHHNKHMAKEWKKCFGELLQKSKIQPAPATASETVIDLTSDLSDACRLSNLKKENDGLKQKIALLRDFWRYVEVSPKECTAIKKAQENKICKLETELELSAQKNQLLSENNKFLRRLVSELTQKNRQRSRKRRSRRASKDEAPRKKKKRS